ncbi:hypothetical protein [Martelella radicis]|uniref:Uncharacterized protein n=1 Tax=Martelella radicis TaxID=1397476 RepID=A0A7W6KMI9_9HYPH|nr:hypothetical protein [Martelella radicis]MBB4123963.1 hypothetical protein [Martelella radicis]
MTHASKNVPFRKQVKDMLNGIGGIATAICGISILIAFFFQSVPSGILGGFIFYSGVIAIICLSWAARIKPRIITTSGGFVNRRSEW